MATTDFMTQTFRIGPNLMESLLAEAACANSSDAKMAGVLIGGYYKQNRMTIKEELPIGNNRNLKRH